MTSCGCSPVEKDTMQKAFCMVCARPRRMYSCPQQAWAMALVAWHSWALLQHQRLLELCHQVQPLRNQGPKTLEVWDAQAVHPPAASHVCYVGKVQARGQSYLEAPDDCSIQNPASVQQHRAFEAPRPDAQSRWNKCSQRPEPHKAKLATSATGGTLALRFPQAHEPAMLRHGIVPDTFGTLQEYKWLWTSALVEELNLR